MILYKILKMLASSKYFNISKKFLCTYMKIKFSMTFNFVNQTRLKSLQDCVSFIEEGLTNSLHFLLTMLDCAPFGVLN